MNEEMFEELEASLKEGMEILRGEAQPSRVFEFDAPNVKEIREELKLTQHQFAAMLGISVRTLQNWEQGRREPEGPAKVLLLVAAKHPKTVLDTVRSTIREKKAAKFQL
jgi:putative transcriptional regulator